MEAAEQQQGLSSLCLWLDSLRPPGWRTRSRKLIPVTSQARQQQAARADQANNKTIREDADGNKEHDETVLYLGYGSNLSAETFRGKRGIEPISQVNVVVPTLSLTFDLPGIPYAEPCFGNVRYRYECPESQLARDQGYHKDNWPKGLVGVVYEVTRADFAHIIATEGGGSGYQDVLVDCYALNGEPSQDVPLKPCGQAFKAHTLFAPARVARPDHSYAQPSPRYLKLITDGASEHGLPLEYQAFLHQIRTFHVTTQKQRLGMFVFMSVWAPLFMFFFSGAGGIFLRKDGTYPSWFARLLNALFGACWASYDEFFKKTFGDGERTIGDSEDKDTGRGDDEALEDVRVSDEKQPLVERVQHKYGAVSSVEEIV